MSTYLILFDIKNSRIDIVIELKYLYNKIMKLEFAGGKNYEI